VRGRAPFLGLTGTGSSRNFGRRSETAEAATFLRARFKHGTNECVGPLCAPGGFPVACAARGHGGAFKLGGQVVLVGLVILLLVVVVISSLPVFDELSS